MELALIGFAVMLVICFLGVPLGFAMVPVGFVGFGLARGWDPALAMVGQVITENSINYGFAVIPLFVMMGNFVHRSELGADLYRASYAFLGHRPGGLAMATVVACGGFSAICGSSVATAATMAKVAMPEMRRYGYADSLATGCVAAGGTLGILIPPSVLMIIFGLLTESDIGKLFIAGILPGILTVTLYLLVIRATVAVNPSLGPKGERAGWPERFRSLGRVWGVLALFVGVLGGIYFGVCTPTEAGGIGAVGALAFALWRRMMSWSDFWGALVDSGRTTAQLFTVTFGALIMSNFVEIAGVPNGLLAWIESLGLPPAGVIVMIIVIYLLLGCVFEGIGMVLITVPIFAPLVVALGYDIIWFGVLVVVVTEISLITPPIGMNAFVLAAVTRIKLSTVFRGVMPFWGGDLVRVTLIVLFPAIALYLPSLM